MNRDERADCISVDTCDRFHIPLPQPVMVDGTALLYTRLQKASSITNHRCLSLRLFSVISGNSSLDLRWNTFCMFIKSSWQDVIHIICTSRPTDVYCIF